MAIDGDDAFVHCQAKLLGSGLQDANVCLMRNQPVDILRGQSGLCQYFLRDIGEHSYRELENCLAVHT